jgi:hypothetical protein
MKNLEKFVIFFFLTNAFYSIGQDGSQIDLATFEARNEGRNNVLFWTAFTEVNNDYYTVERSVDGVIFENVSIVNGAENQSLINNYSIVDLYYTDCINYYRLKQTNIDGLIFYSSMISIDNRIHESKSVVKIINAMGVVVDQNFKGIVIYVYNDNTISKTIQ